jgi:hypothetical protein
MVFSIKQHSTLPLLKLQLIKDGRNEYKNFYEKLENAAVTFAMREVSTGRLQVANEEGLLLQKDQCSDNGEKEYYIAYRFTKEDTDTPGIYRGEFKLTFLDDQSELIAPVSEDLQIHVIESFVKAEVI